MQSLQPSSSRPALVVVEGLDGSGKSTLARDLAEHLGALHLTTPSPAVRAVRGAVIDGLAGSPIARQTFYLATVAHASDTIAAYRELGRSVVLDRYLLSTMVYAQQRGAHLRWPALEALLTPADVTVFLDVPLEVRRRRLARRGMSSADLETLSPSFDAGLRAGYLAWSREPVVGEFLHLPLRGAETPAEVLASVVDRLPLRGAA